ncbi:MAG: NAD(P)H-hydrate epimerase [Caldilineaceae bacterium]
MTPSEMIEQVGRSVAALAEQLLAGDLEARPIVVVAGQGKHGAAALVAARRLWEIGAWVQTVCVFQYAAAADWVAAPLEQLQAMGVPLAWAEEGWELPPCDLLIEAITASNQAEDPQGREREMILLANSSLAPILSIGAPSGTHPETGHRCSPHIHAAATLLTTPPNTEYPAEPARAACGTLYFLDEKGRVRSAEV